MATKPKRVELSVEDVRTPVTDAVAPPASKDPTTLPFRARTWPDFERILLQYAEHADGLRSVRIYGVPGQAQHGIDLYGTHPDGHTVAYQAKNVKTLTAASLRAAVAKFKAEPPPHLDVRHLIVCTACPTNDKTVGEELAKLRRANRKLKIDLYDERTLSDGLRGRPELVRRLFTAAWVVAFCDDAGGEVPQRTQTDTLADSLVRGPLAAFGLVDSLNLADALSDTDPAQAAEIVGHIIDRVTAEGFPGTTSQLRRQRAELLIGAGQIDEACFVLAELAWANRTNAGSDDDSQSEGRLRALAKEHNLPTVRLLVGAIDAVDAWLQQPFPDLPKAIDLALQLDAAGHPLATDLLLWVTETANADRLTLRDGSLIDAVNRHITERTAAGRKDEITVRFRTAVAQLGGDWTSILREARAGWLGHRLAALVHARYGRHLFLHAQPDDAQAEFSAAVQAACHAELGNEAADALYSITQTRLRYGPLNDDMHALPRMAIDLRRQGHTAPLLPGRDPADAGAEALASSRTPSAYRHYRAAIRHCVIRGDAAGEMNAHHHVADILLDSGEPIAAVRHLVRSGSGELVKKKLNVPVYVDLRAEVLDGAHWERATALTIVALQGDLVPDDHVEHYVTVAWAGTSEAEWSPLGPNVDLNAWKAIGALAGRFTEDFAVTVLDQLDGFIFREPNHYRFTDDDHIAAVARIYDAHPSLAPRAADHLSQMVQQEYNLGENVRAAARRFIENPELLLDALRPHAGKHQAAANILSDHGERPPASLRQVAKKIRARLDAQPSPQVPGQVRYSIGTDVPELAQHARGLDEKVRLRFIEYCMALAEDESQPSANRADGMEGVALLAWLVDDATRDALFDRTMPFARLDLPPTKVDQLLNSTHPLSLLKMNLDGGALQRARCPWAARPHPRSGAGGPRPCGRVAHRRRRRDQRCRSHARPSRPNALDDRSDGPGGPSVAVAQADGSAAGGPVDPSERGGASRIRSRPGSAGSPEGRAPGLPDRCREQEARERAPEGVALRCELVGPPGRGDGPAIGQDRTPLESFQLEPLPRRTPTARNGHCCILGACKHRDQMGETVGVGGRLAL